MNFKATAFANAAAVTMAIAYLICSIFVVFFPNIALAVLGSLVHLVNLEKAVDVQVTFTGFLAGFIQLEFYTYLTAWVFVWFYNKFAK